MDKFQDNIEVSLLSTPSNQSDYLREQFQNLIKKFNLEFQQLSKMFDMPIYEIEDLMNGSNNITNQKFEDVENKLAMLNYGFEGFDAKERVKVILNTLLTEYELTIENLSKIINVEEKELIDFKEERLLEKTMEIKISVNIIMLNFVLHK
ncbi:hypothetical protein PVA17_12085 [Lysinibacillus sp. CNPSo 3705]|uniref:HTH domain-containing protein n=1 Tax=Lysinibacillus sp. CNPSo 3705 TaxID=3028148 RepID=UPI00236454FE|nr:HTH domain-containing protein [Lysinibacillus sp. CNPSo 3705]MDD1503496.1 hypothetical protein [Lysinibacillus sp. CNPSo 3705]